MNTPLRNWAGNYAYTAATIHRPRTIDQLRQIVAASTRIRALGTRHCFNSIADSNQDLVSLENFNHVLNIDPVSKTVTVESGIRYGELGQYLHREGFALHNLASLPHISVAGACATATHGSGSANGNLATSIAAMELLKADGEIVQLSRQAHGEQFNGMVVHLGGLGIVTKLTLNILPTFAVRQNIYENLPFAELCDHLEQITSSAYSVSLFTDWQGGNISQVWLKSRETEKPAPASLFGANPAPMDRHPITSISPINCTRQMGVPGPWHERLPHFRLEYTPSSGEELQSEYFVPRDHAVEALEAVSRLADQITPLLFITELRTIAADDLWLSPCYQRPCLAIHFTWKPNWPGVHKLLPAIEESLKPFDARPHWGKLFTMSPAHLQSSYKKLPDFRELLHTCDPRGKFRNPFLDTYIVSHH